MHLKCFLFYCDNRNEFKFSHCFKKFGRLSGDTVTDSLKNNSGGFLLKENEDVRFCLCSGSVHILVFVYFVLLCGFVKAAVLEFLSPSLFPWLSYSQNKILEARKKSNS